MRRSSGLTKEEAFGLFAAIAAHAALVAALTLSPLGRKVQPPPQRMTVTFADNVADQSTSPKPDALAAPDKAPALGEHDQADEPVAVPIPEPRPEPVPVPVPPRPVVKPKPKPAPEPVPEPKPAPKPAPKPKPVPKPEPKPVAKAKPQEKPKPEARPKAEAKPVVDAKPRAEPRPKADAKPTVQPKSTHGDAQAHPHPKTPTGGSKIDDEFTKAFSGVTTPGTDHATPAAKAATVSSASLVSAIARQLSPHWKPPSGVDIDKLVVVLSWTMNPDGSLAGTPVVVSQSGITDANRAQAEIYKERAIKAVQIAAPFQLPAQAYSQWKRVGKFRFDYELTQKETR